MRYYTQSQVAKLLNLSRFTVWKYCNAGKIKTTIFTLIRDNGKEVEYPYISEDDFQAFLNKSGRT